MGQEGLGAGTTPSRLFRGYDSIADGMLDSNAVTGEYDQTGASTVARIKVCQGASEVSKALEIDGSLSVGYLKAAKVTAKMKFAQDLNLTARSTSIVVYASHETGTWSVSNVRLQEKTDKRDAVKPPVGDEDLADFVDAYGDCYVSSATEGGEYYAVYTFNTETETEQRELAGSLQTKVVGAGSKVTADIQGKLSDFLEKTKTSWTLEQKMTGHTNQRLPDESKLIDFALGFSELKLDSPITTNIKVMGYEHVLNIGQRKFGKVVDNRQYFLGRNGLLHSYAQLEGVMNQIAWLKRIYKQYGYSGDTDLLDFEKKVKEDIDRIDAQITAYKRDAAKKLTRPELPSLGKEPVLQYTVGKPPSWGGSGAGPFDFMTVSEALRNHVRLTSIRLFEGDDLLHRIELGYASEKTSWTETHGAGGNGKEKLSIEAGQFPTEFKVRSGNYVDRLEIYLPDGRWTGAGGYKAGESTWKVPAGGVVLGFEGRAGALIDELRIIHAKLEKAKMVATD